MRSWPIEYPVRRALAVVVASIVLPAVASAEDRVSVGYVASTSIVATGSGLAQAVAGGWERRLRHDLDVGAGAELGVSGGHETSLVRFTPLVGVAFVRTFDAITLRLEQQIGWQLVHGHLTLDAIPIAGTETRGFHDELMVALEAPVSRRVSVRGRGGIAVDGLYPAGHLSTHVTPCVGVSLVFFP